MQKNILIVVIILTILAIIAGGGYFYWSKYYKKKEAPVIEKKVENVKKAEKAGETLIKSSTKSTIPEINPQSNPLEKLPETNPIDQTNPFKGLKINPFE